MFKKLDFSYLLNRKYATYKEVMQYKNCSREQALEIIQELVNDAIDKDLYVSIGKVTRVPMPVFIDYFNINPELAFRYHDSVYEFENRKRRC